MRNDNTLEIYLAFIKKATNKKVWIIDEREDIQQEVFIKLFKKDFFTEHPLDGGFVKSQAGKYIYDAVSSCFSDHVIRKRYKEDTSNDSNDGKKTYFAKVSTNVDFVNNDEGDQSVFSSPLTQSSVSIEAKEALDLIKRCFEKYAEATKDQIKATFFESAFWHRNYLDTSIKELAEDLGFIHTNPTQEFNRFVKKVSGCTEKGDVILSAVDNQLEILLQLAGDEMYGSGEVNV